MSLLDTIKGAREEAQEAASQRTSTKKATDNAAASDDAQSSAVGFSRRSAARAKPTREVAGTVRAGEKPKSEMTKEEKKAARDARRNKEDLLYDAKRAALEEDEKYGQTQHIWWGLLIAGIILTLISWGLMNYLNGSESKSETTAFASIAFMVCAYVLVIGAFIYDMVKVRPLRKAADEKVMGMSSKRLKRYTDQAAERKAAKKQKK